MRHFGGEPWRAILAVKGNKKEWRGHIPPWVTALTLLTQRRAARKQAAKAAYIQILISF